jgi:endonuclease/exonuclease/phosphatase family metal-dependent hydrolase
LYFHDLGWPFALIIVMYLVAIFRVAVIDLSARTNPGRSLVITGLVYIIGHLAVVWSVAWCFVPDGTGGEFMRDRIYQVFCIFVAGTALAVNSTPPQNQPASKRDNGHRTYNSFPPMKVVFAIFIVLLCVTGPAFYKRAQSWRKYDGNGVQQEYVRGMAWAIRFGYNNRGWPNHVDVTELIKNSGANTIGLVETDTARPFNANWDVVEYLEEHLHMRSDYGPPTTKETWGCALLTVFPVVRSFRSIMPSPTGETACFIDATILVQGEEIDVIVSHFGNTQHVIDRNLQAKFEAERIAKKRAEGRKMVWLGYLTDRPHGSSYELITKAGAVDAAPGHDRYCLYLFHMGMETNNFERYDTGMVSDTEIQIADFYLPGKSPS